jgi:SAM-dependent methyltransferase
LADSSFGPVAPYYDHLMSRVPYDMWTAYYQLLLMQLEQKPEVLLDVACGTGTMCEMLDEQGYAMTGFDVSAPMIEEAKRKAEEQQRDIEYYCQDAAELDLPHTFQGAFSFFDSLNYITDPEHLNRAIQRVYDHLDPGGTFVFDVNTAYAFEQDMFSQKDLDPRTELQYHWVGEYDPEMRLIEVNMQFWYKGQEFREVHRQRAYRTSELMDMLTGAGFCQIEVYDSYTLNPPRKKSDRIHFTAVRPAK